MAGPVLPFTLRRKKDVVSVLGVTSTKETTRGLLRLDGDNVVLQWRTERKIDRVGLIIATEREVDHVREVTLPLSVFANAEVRRLWFRWPPGRYLILSGSDLRAFDDIAGTGGIPVRNPAELAVRIDRAAYPIAMEFAGEIRMSVADRALRAAERSQIQSGGDPE